MPDEELPPEYGDDTEGALRVDSADAAVTETK